MCGQHKAWDGALYIRAFLSSSNSGREGFRGVGHFMALR